MTYTDPLASTVYTQNTAFLSHRVHHPYHVPLQQVFQLAPQRTELPGLDLYQLTAAQNVNQVTIHNLFYYLDMMKAMRQSIRLCRFEEWRGETLRRLAASEQDGS